MRKSGVTEVCYSGAGRELRCVLDFTTKVANLCQNAGIFAKLIFLYKEN